MRCDGVRRGLCFVYAQGSTNGSLFLERHIRRTDYFLLSTLFQGFLDPVFRRAAGCTRCDGFTCHQNQRNDASSLASASSSSSSHACHRCMEVSCFIGSHDTAVERFTRVLFALATRHLGSSFSTSLSGSFLLTLPDGFGGRMRRLEDARDESWRHAASLRSSTASVASLASRHLDSGRARTSSCFFKPCWGWTDAKRCDRLRVLLHPCRPW